MSFPFIYCLPSFWVGFWHVFKILYIAIFRGRKFALTNSFCPLFLLPWLSYGYQAGLGGYLVFRPFRSGNALVVRYCLRAFSLFVFPLKFLGRLGACLRNLFNNYFFGILTPFLVLSCLKRLGQFHPPLPLFLPLLFLKNLRRFPRRFSSSASVSLLVISLRGLPLESLFRKGSLCAIAICLKNSRFFLNFY